MFLDSRFDVYARTAPVETRSSTACGCKIDCGVHLCRDGVLGEQWSRDFMTKVQKVLKTEENGSKIDSELYRAYSEYVEYDKKKQKFERKKAHAAWA